MGLPVDWELARRTAERLSRPARRSPARRPTELVARLRADADDGRGARARGHRARPRAPAAARRRGRPARLGGRRARRHGGVHRRRSCPTSGRPRGRHGAHGRGAARQGLAYLGGRVLGQYDPFGGADGEGRLLLVAPNVRRGRAALDVPPARLPAVGVPARGHPPAPVHGGAVAAVVLRRARCRGRSRSPARPPPPRRLPERVRTLRESKAVRGPSSSCCRRPSSAPSSTGCSRSPPCWRATPTTSWTPSARGRADGRDDPRAVHHPAPRRRAWSTGSCARCSAWRPRCASTPSGSAFTSTS